MARTIHRVGFWGLLLAGASSAALLCSCSSGTEGDASSADTQSSASIGLDLQLGSGLALNQLTYTISGPASFLKTGTLDVSNSTIVSGIIAGLPVGTGYTISLSGSTTDGGTTCVGSASFSVVARQTALVSVHLQCEQAPLNGSVSVNGTLNICPVADGIMANPSEVTVGSTIALSASAHDSDNGPAPLSYTWSATSGTFSDATAAAPTFTCTTPGTATIAVSVSDGDTDAGCADQTSVTVTCTPTSTEVQAIVDTNCTSCHSGSAPPRGLSLVDIRSVVGSAASGCPAKLRIVPGNAAESYLVDKILGVAQDGGCFSGKQMPLGKAPLAAGDIATITSWINAGTP
jgi:hypothetical protein